MRLTFRNPSSGFPLTPRDECVMTGGADRLVFRMCGWLACDETPVERPQRKKHLTSPADVKASGFAKCNHYLLY